MFDNRVGELIKITRKARGISAAKLGEMIGVSQQAISKYENGKRKISVDTLEKIAAALNFPASDLLLEKQIDDSRRGTEQFLGYLEVSPIFENYLKNLGYNVEEDNEGFKITYEGKEFIFADSEYKDFESRIKSFVDFEFEQMHKRKDNEYKR